MLHTWSIVSVTKYDTNREREGGREGGEREREREREPCRKCLSLLDLFCLAL